MSREIEMKNKIFELYKPNSLAEFLDFYKKNPEERFVYVVQHKNYNHLYYLI